jgi:hypothetical protein
VIHGWSMVMAVFKMYFHYFVLALGLKTRYSYCTVHVTAHVILLFIGPYIDGVRGLSIVFLVQSKPKDGKMFVCRKRLRANF